eukprot:6204458-Pleurochrysis_carterae.AAC.1
MTTSPLKRKMVRCEQQRKVEITIVSRTITRCRTIAPKRRVCRTAVRPDAAMCESACASLRERYAQVAAAGDTRKGRDARPRRGVRTGCTITPVRCGMMS